MRILIIFISIFVIQGVFTECDFGDFKALNGEHTYNPEPRNGDLQTFKGVINADVQLDKGEYKDYFEITPNEEETEWVFKLKDIEKYVETWPSNENAKIITCEITVNCKPDSDDSPIKILVDVNFKPVNDNDPTFVDEANNKISSITYTLPMPFPNIPIDWIGDPIIGRDIDIYNKNIEFSVDKPKEFSISASVVDGSLNKRYTAELRAPQGIQEETTVTITATDNTANIEDPPKTAKLIIYIKKNAEASVIQFNKHYFAGDYNIETNIVENVGEITIDSSKAAVSLEGDFNECFDINMRASGIITTKDCTKPYNQESIELNIVAKIEDKTVASATLVLKIIKKSFKKVLYVGTFNNIDHKLTLGPIELIGASPNTKVELDANDYANFKCDIKNKDDKPIIIECGMTGEFKDPIERFKLIAKQIDDNNDIGVSAIIELEIISNLPPKFPIEFVKKQYIGSIDNDQPDILKLEEMEIKTESAESITTTLEGDEHKLFRADVTGKIVTLKLIKEEAVITYLKVITLTLVAKTATATSYTIIVLEVKQKNEDEDELVEFKEHLYEGTIENGAIKIIEDIMITTHADQVEDFSLDGTYKDQFETPTMGADKKVTLELVQSATFPKGVRVVTLEMAANTEPATNTGYTTIVLEIKQEDEDDDDKLVQFEEHQYEGTIENGAIKNIGEIIITTHADEVKDISLDGTYKDQFETPKIGADKKVTVELVQSATFPKGVRVVTLEMAANTEPATNTGYTTIVLEIKPEDGDDDDKLVQFKEHLYEGTIENGAIKNIGEIIITTHADEVEDVSLDGTYKDQFETPKMGADKKVTLELVQGATFPKGVRVVILEMAANTEPATNAGYTTIVLEVKQEDDDDKLVQFKEHLYEGTIENGAIKDIGDIIITTHAEEVEDVSLDGTYKDQFETPAMGADKKVTLELVQGATFPKDLRVVTLEMAANTKPATNTGYTTIVLEVKQKEEEDSVEFKEDLYHGTIDTEKDDNKLEIEEDIIILNGKNVIAFSLTGTFKNKFKTPSQEDGKVLLELKDDAEFTTDVKVVTLKMEATTDSESDIVYTTIVLEVKHKKDDDDDDDSIKFEKALYVGTIDIETSGLKLINEIKIVTEEIIENVTLTGESEENFKTPNVNGKTVHLDLIDNFNFPPETKIITLTLEGTTALGKGITTIVLEILHKKEVQQSVYFEPHNLVYTRYDNELPWNVNQFKAYSDDSADTFEYSIKENNDKVTIDSEGNLHVKVGLAEGVYEFEIIAKSTKNPKYEGSTTVVLIIYEMCHDTTVWATYSHLIVHQEEEASEEIILEKPENHEEYGYCIVAQDPSDDVPGMFTSDNGTIKCKKLDREAACFKDMAVPQYTLKVKLILLDKILEDGKCPSEVISRQFEKVEGGINMEETTANSADSTVISVIIDDINDNSPTFKEKKRTVCYPNKELVDYIRPPFLTKVEATDRDAPEQFGKVTYMSLHPEYLQVNPTNGEVYPTTQMFDDNNLKYDIKAYNMDDDTKNDITTINVKLIGAEHIGMLSIEKQVNEVEGFLACIATDGVTVHALSVGGMYENLPEVIVNRFNRTRENEGGEKRSLDIIVYALKDDTPLTIPEMEIFFSDAGEGIVARLETAANIPPAESSSDDNTGLIAAVSVLAVLVVLMLAGGAFWYRKHRNQSIPNDRTASDSGSNSPISTPEFAKQTKSITTMITPDQSPRLDVKKKAPAPPINQSVNQSMVQSESITEEEKHVEFDKLPSRESVQSKKIQRRDTAYIFGTVNVSDDEDDDNVDSGKDTSKQMDSEKKETTSDNTKSVTFNSDVLHGVIYEDNADETVL